MVGDDEKSGPEAFVFAGLWATRNFGLFTIALGGYGIWRSVASWDPGAHPFKSSAYASFFITLATIGVAILWSYAYAAFVHPTEPIDFWRQKERRWRGLILGACSLAGIACSAGIVVALALSHPRLAGALLGPALWGDLIGIAIVTGGISPMFSS